MQFNPKYDERLTQDACKRAIDFARGSKSGTLLACWRADLKTNAQLEYILRSVGETHIILHSKAHLIICHMIKCVHCSVLDIDYRKLRLSVNFTIQDVAQAYPCLSMIYECQKLRFGIPLYPLCETLSSVLENRLH